MNGGASLLLRNDLYGGVHHVKPWPRAVFVNGTGQSSPAAIGSTPALRPIRDNVRDTRPLRGPPNAVLVNNPILSGSSTKGNSVGVWIGANGLVAVNNTIVGGNPEIAGGGDGSQGVFAVGASGAATLFINNQFVLGTSVIGNQRAHLQASYAEVVLLNNNLYDGASPSGNEGYGQSLRLRVGHLQDEVGSEHARWACTVWPASAGCSTDSANNFDADPLFVDAASGDYFARSGEPPERRERHGRRRHQDPVPRLANGRSLGCARVSAQRGLPGRSEKRSAGRRCVRVGQSCSKSATNSRDNVGRFHRDVVASTRAELRPLAAGRAPH